MDYEFDSKIIEDIFVHYNQTYYYSEYIVNHFSAIAHRLINGGKVNYENLCDILNHSKFNTDTDDIRVRLFPERYESFEMDNYEDFTIDKHPLEIQNEISFDVFDPTNCYHSKHHKDQIYSLMRPYTRHFLSIKDTTAIKIIVEEVPHFRITLKNMYDAVVFTPLFIAEFLYGIFRDSYICYLKEDRLHVAGFPHGLNINKTFINIPCVESNKVNIIEKEYDVKLKETEKNYVLSLDIENFDTPTIDTCIVKRILSHEYEKIEILPDNVI